MSATTTVPVTLSSGKTLAMSVLNTLPNGAQVLRRIQVEPNFWFVLAFWSGHTAPYVTWATDSEGNAYWGNYHREFHEADTDFARRVNRRIKTENPS
jgi:hypothetical protein